MSFQEEIAAWLATESIGDSSRVVAVPVCATDVAQAVQLASARPLPSPSAIMVPEDRWRHSPEMIKPRILAHLGVFSQVYARNCIVRRIGKPEAASFLERSHSYGDAACRYRYGLFLKRITGEKCNEALTSGSLVAVAEFSGARRWRKTTGIISSYEWVRYASLPGVRVIGGMGKMLNHFISEVHPDDVMTYADLEWSDGQVYRQLGFVEEGRTGEVLFSVDPVTWKRTAIKKGREPSGSGLLCHISPGSVKYRLKLTDY